MRRRIVFVNQATGYLTIDIINEFAKEFDDVGVIYGDIRIQDVNLDPKVKRSLIIEKSRKSNLKRFNRWFVASVQTFFLLATKYRKYEIFYFSIPPFAYFSSLLFRRRFSLLMWDVYPDALKSAGISDKRLIYRIWTRVNRILFNRAFRLYTIGEGPARLMSKYVPKEKIIVIPLWTGLKDAGPVNKNENPFITDNNIQDKFIVEYSGNIGETHNIESLIEVARLTKDDNSIIYLLIGRGTKMELVNQLIKEYSLDNCRVLPFQPDNIIKYSLAAADLSVVLVDENAAEVIVPSKVNNLFAVGSPLLCISPDNSEINRLIKRYDAGNNFDKKDYPGMVSFIKRMKESPELLSKYREKSLKASEDFTVANAQKYLDTYIS